MKGVNHKDASSDYYQASNNSKPSSLIWGIEAAKPWPHSARPLMPRFMIFLLLSISLIYFLYTLNLLLSSYHQPPCPTLPDPALHTSSSSSLSLSPPRPQPQPQLRPYRIATLPSLQTKAEPTNLRNIVFGIAASSRLWQKRREYISAWWRPGRMRGYVWLDRPVWEGNASALPALKISADTSRFPYTHRQGSRSAIRISRVVSETLRLLGPRDKTTRWLVMGDDDTVFLPNNLVRVLSRFDHTQFHYIGSLSESHLQNIHFSYNMAYGGGGFAISRPLAEALQRFQDRCLRRYPALYGSDDRMQACMAELGVPLTRHPGFHQYDVYGDLLGLLAAHPVAPLVSLHHLDVVQPIFPTAPSRSAALKRLFDGPVELDSSAVMQQSICYDSNNTWTVSVSWGFAVQVIRGVMSPREMEMPARTFLNWYRRADYTAYAFNTRPVARNPCQRPFLYYLSATRYDAKLRTTITTYERRKEAHPLCRWKIADPSTQVDRVLVYKKPDPSLWDRSPRRNCCRVLPRVGKQGEKTMSINVGVCSDGEISEI